MLAVLVIGVIGTTMTLFALLVFDFLTAVNTMMELVVVVTGPCMAVYATDIALRRNRYDGEQLHDQSRRSPFWYRGGVNWAGLLYHPGRQRRGDAVQPAPPPGPGRSRPPWTASTSRYPSACSAPRRCTGPCPGPSAPSPPHRRLPHHRLPHHRPELKDRT